jgi:phage shock protein C
VRLVWVLLFLAGGAGILLYIVAAIVIPEEPAGYAATAAAAGEGAAGTPAGAGWMGQRRDTGGGAIVLGLVLVLAGGWFLAQRIFPQLDPQLVWPAVLIVLGVVLVVGALRRSSGEGS